MSAASQQLGLAESQDIHPYNDREDPGRAWIDLVLAFKANNPEQVRALLELAKKSQWTHTDWDDATADHETDSEDAEGDIYPPHQQEDFFDDM